MFHVSLIDCVEVVLYLVLTYLRLAGRVSFSRLLPRPCRQVPGLWWMVVIPMLLAARALMRRVDTRNDADIFITPICFSYFPTFQLKYVYPQICVWCMCVVAPLIAMF